MMLNVELTILADEDTACSLLANKNIKIIKYINNKYINNNNILDIDETIDAKDDTITDINNSNLNTNVQTSTDVQNSTEVQNNANIQKPRLTQVQGYCYTKQNHVIAEDFYEYYEKLNWIDKAGNPITDWKAKVDQWDRKAIERGTPIPAINKIYRGEIDHSGDDDSDLYWKLVNKEMT